MNCPEARDQILTATIDDDALAHIDGCEACAELAAAEGRLARALGNVPKKASDPLGFDKVKKITSEQDSDAVWRLRGMPTNRRLALGLASTLVGAIVCLVALRRPDWEVYPMVRMGALLGAMFFAAGFGVVMSMPLYYKPERPFVVRIAVFGFLLVIPFIPAIFGVAHTAHPASVTDGSLWLAAGKCLGFGTVAAFPALLTIRLLQRDRKMELWPTLFAALAAAIGANIALQAHCPIVAQSHILVGHSILGIVYAVLAWIVVRVSVRG